MIRIFNKKLDSEIYIDETVDWIQFSPRDYEEIPYVIIEMKNFDFGRHANNCNECKSFMDSLGRDSVDWYISYSNKVYRLNTSKAGQGEYPSTELKITMSYYNPGSKLTLIFHEIPIDKGEIAILLEQAVEQENYKKACVLRDLINEEN